MQYIAKRSPRARRARARFASLFPSSTRDGTGASWCVCVAEEVRDVAVALVPSHGVVPTARVVMARLPYAKSASSGSQTNSASSFASSSSSLSEPDPSLSRSLLRVGIRRRLAPSIDLLIGEELIPCAAAALAPSSHAAGATMPRRVLRDDDAHLPHAPGARSGERDARVLAASRARRGAIAAVRSHAAACTRRQCAHRRRLARAGALATAEAPRRARRRQRQGRAGLDPIRRSCRARR